MLLGRGHAGNSENAEDKKNKRSRRSVRNTRGCGDFEAGGAARPEPDGAGEGGRRPIRRGEIWFADLGGHKGTSVQGGCRPVFVISNDLGNRHADTYNVLPMTSRMKKHYLPSHAVVDTGDVTWQGADHAHGNTDRSRQGAGDAACRNENPDLLRSMILAEQITTISRGAFLHYAGTVTGENALTEIEDAVRRQLGL